MDTFINPCNCYNNYLDHVILSGTKDLRVPKFYSQNAAVPCDTGKNDTVTRIEKLIQTSHTEDAS